MNPQILLLKITLQALIAPVLFLHLQSALFAQTIPVPPRLERQEPDVDQRLPDYKQIDPLLLPGGDEQFLLDTPDQFVIRSIRFSGNQVIDDETIRAAIAGYEGQVIDKSELSQVEDAINAIYQKAGYKSSRAFISDQSRFEDEQLDLYLQIIEVKLTKIEVSSPGRLEHYVKQHFSPLKKNLLNSDRLANKVRFLILDERTKNIDVSVNFTPILDQRTLSVEVTPAKLWSVTGLLNNARSPSVGSFERGFRAQHLNVVGLGDTITFDYRNTEGSNLVGVGYDIPVSASGGTLELDYLWGKSQIVREPFRDFEIETSTQSFGVGFNQPILRQSSNKMIQELSVGLGFNRTENNDQILGEPFPVTEGANVNGKIRSTRLDLFQHFTRKTLKSTLYLDSTFGFGLGIGTTNDPAFGDGSFVKWNGQGVFAYDLTPKLLSISRANLQFADRDLIGNEQFALGGRDSVRGFLTNQFSRTNGLSLSQEFRYRVYEKKNEQLDFSAFIDFGTAWNDKPQINESTQTMGAVGIGLIYRLEGMRAAVEYGIPIFGQEQPSNSLQGSGVLLSFQFTF